METYILKHKNELVRSASRSGGVFTALTDIILADKGIVYGCMLTNDLRVVHGRAINKEQRDRFRKSKYVQSDLNDTLCKVKTDLQAGYTVLFSGTPCQVAGLKAFLNTAKDLKGNLYCVDIICHGVPSPRVWHDYVELMEKRYGGKIERAEFINKNKFGWAAHKESVWVNGVEHDNNIYTNLFGGHNVVRPACFHCPFKSLNRMGDITIGDAWGVKRNNPEFDDNKGVSLVLVNTEEGKKLFFDACRENCDFVAVDINDYLQHPLVSPYGEPVTREKFWKLYNKKGFETVVKRYIELNIFRKILRRLKRKFKIAE